MKRNERMAEGSDYINIAVAEMEQAKLNYGSIYAEILCKYAVACFDQGFYGPTKDYYERVLTIYETENGIQSSLAVSANIGLGSIFRKEGNASAAIGHWKLAVEKLEAEVEENTGILLFLYNQLKDACNICNDPVEM